MAWPQNSPRLFDLLESHWFGPSPGTSYKTHDSAGSMDGDPRRKSLASVGKRDTKPAACQQKGRSPSFDSAHSVGSAESVQQALAAQGSRRSQAGRPAAPSPSLPMQSYKSQPGTARMRPPPTPFDPTTLPGLGTWAQRQLRFQAEGSSVAEQEQASTPAMGQPPSVARRSPRRTSADEEEVAARAAWRWRFNRRWANEQAKQWDPPGKQTGLDGDAWDDALEMLDACGPDGRAQLCRTESTEQGPATPHPLSPLGSGLSNCMLAESKPEASPLLQPEAESEKSRNVAAVARKAHSLYRQQLQIEQQVEKRWDSAAAHGAAWVGQQLRTVVDSYGTCPYILARVSERSGPSKLLVRGSHGCSPANLEQALVAEAETLRRNSMVPLPPVAVTVLGSGTIEWLGDRDDRVLLRCGHVAKGVTGALDSRYDVARVTGSVLRTACPLRQRLHVQVA